MEDVLNQKLDIDNIVMFTTPAIKGLVTGRIIGFTDSKVRVEYASAGKTTAVEVKPIDVMKAVTSRKF